VFEQVTLIVFVELHQFLVWCVLKTSIGSTRLLYDRPNRTVVQLGRFTIAMLYPLFNQL